ncbi:MAG: ATP-grasp domain-containing protein [Firmicutes bacterium]|nr:ATP-grasp domain-containing protein [Bacillota bacterium]
MSRTVDQALLMNNVQKVPYYRELWHDKRMELLFFDPVGIDWEGEMIVGLQLKGGRWRKGYFAFPQTVYNRCFPEPTHVINALKEVVGAKNVFNSLTHFDKWEVYQALRGSEVEQYLPPTYQYDQLSLPKILAEHGSIILKPRLGHGGYGVTRVTLVMPNLVIIQGQGFPIPVWGEESYLPYLIAIAPPEKFIAQQYIEGGKEGSIKADVRLLMQKNKSGSWEVGGQLSRVTTASTLLTNHYQAIVPPSEVVSAKLVFDLQSISYVVATTLDDKLATLGELGVDFLIDETDYPWILEVNGKPDKSLFMKLGDDEMLKRVYLNPLDYQQYLLGN